MTAHQQAHYFLLLALDARKFPPQALRISKLIAERTILLGRHYTYFPKKQHLALLLGMDHGDLSGQLKWLKLKQVVDEPVGGWYALNAPAQWSVPQHPAGEQLAELSAWLLQHPYPDELRDPLRRELLDKAGCLNEALREIGLASVVVSGDPHPANSCELARTPGAQVTTVVEPEAKAGFDHPAAAVFDVSRLLELCKADLSSPAVAEYLAAFPEAKRAYDQAARGGGTFPQPVGLSQERCGTFPPAVGVSHAASCSSSSKSSALNIKAEAFRAEQEKAWEKLQAIDSIGVLLDQFRAGEWRAIAERSPNKVLAFIGAMESRGWLDKYGRKITGRLAYMASPARAEKW